MPFQRLIYMCPAAQYDAANDFFGELYNQPGVGQTYMNASTTGELPKTHSVGSAYFTEEQVPVVLDWFTTHEGCGVVYAEPTDYVWGVAFNNWGLRLAEDPL